MSPCSPRPEESRTRSGERYRSPDRRTARLRLDALLVTVDRAQIPRSRPSPTASGNCERNCSPASTTDYLRLRRRRDQQDQGAQAPSLRAAGLHRLQEARRHGLRLAGPADATAQSAGTQISSGGRGQFHAASTRRSPSSHRSRRASSRGPRGANASRCDRRLRGAGWSCRPPRCAEGGKGAWSRRASR